ncbi:hypothetical protein RUND412_006872 [Rhizina undulata]
MTTYRQINKQEQPVFDIQIPQRDSSIATAHIPPGPWPPDSLRHRNCRTRQYRWHAPLNFSSNRGEATLLRAVNPNALPLLRGRLEFSGDAYNRRKKHVCDEVVGDFYTFTAMLKYKTPLFRLLKENNDVERVITLIMNNLSKLGTSWAQSTSICNQYHPARLLL